MTQRATPSKVRATEERLKELVGENNIVDLGNAHLILDISKTTLMAAIRNLEQVGYKRFYVPVRNEYKRSMLRLLTRADLTYAGVVLRLPEVKQVIKPAKGLSTAEIYRRTRDNIALLHEGINQTAEARQRISKAIRVSAARNDKIRRAQAMKRAGYSNVAIGRVLGVHESTVRRLLKAVPQRVISETTQTDWEAVTRFFNGTMEAARKGHNTAHLMVSVYSDIFDKTLTVVIPEARVDDFMKHLPTFEAQVTEGR